MKKTIIIVTTLLSTTISWGQSNSYPETGDVSISDANIKIDKVNGKGIKFYQEDANRFGQVLLETGSGTGDGTKNTLLIEAGNTYGTNYGQRILFKTADADRLVIEHDGKVGIGTASPTEKLSVENGNIKIDKVNGKGIKFYQEDANRFGQVLLETGSGTGDGTKNTLLIEAGNTYGTNYGQRILFKTADTDRLVIEHDGKVGIGTTSPDAELAVRGTIHTQEVKVDMNGWFDFVFKSDYELRTLEEVEEHINEKGHLPEIPNEEEVKENGINLGEMNAKLLQKIEELTLYMIDMNKQLKSQSKRMVQLEQENSQLKRKVSDLKNK